MRPIKPAEEIKNGSITVATSEASFQNVDPDINQHVASGDIVSGNTDRFDNINYYAQDGKLIPIVGQTPAAAYSLRALSGKTNARVVRLRRESDDAERDFSAGDLISSESADFGANGGFDTDTVWAKGDGWSITGGQAVCDGTNVTRSFISQNGAYPAPTPWIKITFTIVACSDFDNAGFYAAATSLSKFSTRGITTPGTYSFILDRSDGGTANYRFYTEAGVTLTVDDASVVVYTPSEAELWALENTVIQGSRLVQESAYVTTWYDQSGNGNNATQATTAAQPLLILAGLINTSNGLPALSFDGNNDKLSAGNGWFPTSGAYLAAGVLEYEGSAGDDSCLFGTGGSLNGFWYINTDFGTATDQARVFNDAEVFVGSSLLSAGQVLYTFYKSGDTEGAYYNGVDDGSGTRTTTNTDNDFTIGSHPTSARLFTGNIQELVVYASDQSANRTKIEKSINDYYNIYAYPDKPLISDTNPEAAAAYSLRYLSDYPTETPVVRVRRGSDDVERDLRAGEIVAGTAGADLIINGDFSDGANNWNLSANWSVAGGQASSDGTSVGVCRQFGKMGLEAGNYFKVTFDIVACNDFTKSGTQHDSNIVTLFSNQGITSTGTYTQLVRTNGLNGHTVFYSLTGGTLTIDNVIVEPYTPSELELWVATSASSTSWQNNQSAYVTTWYDQSGNGNHATQATQSAQPKLITAGVMNTENGKPAMVFDATLFLEAPSFGTSQPSWSFSVLRLDAATTGVNRYIYSTAGNDVSYIADFADRWSLTAGGVPGRNTSSFSYDQLLTANEFNSPNSSYYVNGAEAVLHTGDIGNNGFSAVLRIGAAALAPSNGIVGTIQEMIFYASDQSAKRISIENQINSYYGIY